MAKKIARKKPLSAGADWGMGVFTFWGSDRA